MEHRNTLPLDWQPGDVTGWRIALTPLDSLGFPLGKYGARVSTPARDDLDQFAATLGELVRATVLQEMKKVYQAQASEIELTLD